MSAERRVILIGMGSTALYLVSYWATRALFRETVFSAGWVLVYLVATAALFFAYVYVLRLCRHGELQDRSARHWALALPCAFYLVLWLSVPSLSEDVFSYMAHGVLGTTPGANPLLQPAEQAAQTDAGAGLQLYGWHGEIGITPYGILWTRIEIAVMRHGATHLGTALLLMKCVVAAASLGSAWMIWRFLGRVRPGSQLFGTLAYLWNPLILVEFAGEGHNDAVMVFFVMAALAASASGHGTRSLVAQWFGVLTKYVPLIFFPAQLVYAWRTRRSTRRAIGEVLAALAIALGVAAVLYAPLWEGMHSFDGLLRRGQPISSASPFGALNWVLRRSPLAASAATLTIAVMTLPLLAFVAWISLRVKDAAGLAYAFAWISLAYVLFSSPDFWPWYACLPVALMIAADAAGFLWLVIFMSAAARICAPLDLLRAHDFVSMAVAKGGLTGLGATLPLAALLVWMARRRRWLRLPAL